MTFLRNILVPTDFSDCASAAERRALKLARVLHASLRFVHVMDQRTFVVLDAAGSLPAQNLAVAQELAEATLAERVQRAAESGVRSTSEVVFGSPALAILDAVEATGADLIVMGTHGRSGFRHLVLGSVAERVARKSPVPVLTVRAHPQAQSTDDAESSARD